MLLRATLPADVQLEGFLGSQSVERRHLELAREAELRLRVLRLQIKAHLADARDGRCYCGNPLDGRADQVYCSANCRERAYLARQRSDD